MDIETETVLCENCKVMINKNITSENNNFIYFANGDQYILTIPEGAYTIYALIKEIQRMMKENSHENVIKIFPNPHTSHCELRFLRGNFAIQFGNKSKTFHKILGFRKGVYSSMYDDKIYISQNPINITGK
jgi:hypothetical protein